MNGEVHPMFKDNFQLMFGQMPTWQSGYHQIMSICATNVGAEEYYHKSHLISNEKFKGDPYDNYFIPKAIIPSLIKCLTEIYEGEENAHNINK